ncbi:hypothetical protein DFH07DRAFT_974163 [Mycena maculata]|uniref:Uncharacterized protein n=1 Tax=Mycena maculata TaxID=230809 RepID=A0AAD7H924_9AGAR|nr:hypothetical protein DFH07DRAFT_974163 [Mycena maculata]
MTPHRLNGLLLFLLVHVLPFLVALALPNPLCGYAQFDHHGASAASASVFALDAETLTI